MNLNLFLDIDGVLLGKVNPSSHEVTLALSAEDFIDFVIKNFNCFWLTTHCKGNTADVLEYLSPYTTKQVIKKLSAIMPTNFITLKTDALFGNYIWIDDSPLAYEIQTLERSNNIHRWLEVNTYRRPHDLCRCLAHLQNLRKTNFSQYKLGGQDDFDP